MSMAKNETIVRFDDVSHHFNPNKPVLDEASFSVRRGAKITLMGQNGAGKSTMFKMITKSLPPEEGEITLAPRLTIATSRQVIPQGELDLTVRAFFEKCFDHKVYDIDPRID